MKKILFIAIVFLLSSVLFNSCEKEYEFDETLLYGKWKQGTLYYKYLSDHTGATWDTSEDVTEEEAQKFTWTLVNSELRQIHIMEIGGEIPKNYNITELTATSLKYNDSFSSYSFSKVN
ncbi:MAG: hypothetical protein LBV47_03060 [Bacteroidales bacterium]|jgi:hypothetical protein|nr:hypothetical protein [Bacteroidales bacterium]